MSEFIEIQGGTPLRGEVRVDGAKNAVLPLLISSLLTSETVKFKNVPNLSDVTLLLHLLKQFGSEVEYSGNEVTISTPRLIASEASYSLVKAIRASFWVLGPLLARGGAARVALPGGDILGARPVNLHLDALTKMGAEIQVKHGVVYASAVSGLRAATIDLGFPSVGATHQVLMAAVLTPGRTVIKNAAREPEIVALAQALIAMGGVIEGAGTDEIVIDGVSDLGGAEIHVIGDRIEAATFMLAAAATNGSVKVSGVEPWYFGNFLGILTEMGVEVVPAEGSVTVRAPTELRPVNVRTEPFPGFATDIQAPLMAALCVAGGESTIEESIYQARFNHVSELSRMGAKILLNDRVATITGVPRLSGAPVEAHDIRAAASLAIAALSADGITEIHEPQHIWRGYSNFVEKVTVLGARVLHRIADPEDYVLSGC